MATFHDDEMPAGWHTIKSVLLVELLTASNFHLCCQAAEALFHARLLGSSVAREGRSDVGDGVVTGAPPIPWTQRPQISLRQKCNEAGPDVR